MGRREEQLSGTQDISFCLICQIASVVGKGEAYLAFKTNFLMLSVLQKKRMRSKATWGKAGGPLDIMKACQEITTGRGNPA